MHIYKYKYIYIIYIYIDVYVYVCVYVCVYAYVCVPISQQYLMFSDIAKADVFAGPDSPSDKWLEQPLSHSGRAAGAAAHSATLPEWLTQHSATVAERLEQPLTQPLCQSG